MMQKKSSNKNLELSYLVLLEKLNYRFKDISIFKLALTHSTKNKSCKTFSNERLEFLGDRVLGIVISKKIYEKFFDESEGELSKRFADLVSKKCLTKIAKKLNLTKFVETKIVFNNKKNVTDSILADTLEAILAAIFLDSGYNTVEKVILNLWDPLIKMQKFPPNNPKSKIQEWCLREKKPFPEYSIFNKTGPDHKPIFKVVLIIKNNISTIGEGNSIQEAEFMAAKKAIKVLINDK